MKGIINRLAAIILALAIYWLAYRTLSAAFGTFQFKSELTKLIFDAWSFCLVITAAAVQICASMILIDKIERKKSAGSDGDRGASIKF